MGPGLRTLEHIKCPFCGEMCPISFQGGNRNAVYFHCRDCLPDRLMIGRNLPGLPSDLSYVRTHGRSLVIEAAEVVRKKMEERKVASYKAEDLLVEHLNHLQRTTYSLDGSFDVHSCFTELLLYRISVSGHGSFVDVHPRRLERPQEDFVAGISLVPRLGEAIRGAAARVFEERGLVRLCLSVMGPWLPAADHALAYKLFIESNESRVWVKGMRIHLGMAPEPLRFPAWQTAM